MVIQLLMHLIQVLKKGTPNQATLPGSKSVLMIHFTSIFDLYPILYASYFFHLFSGSFATWALCMKRCGLLFILSCKVLPELLRRGKSGVERQPLQTQRGSSKAKKNERSGNACVYHASTWLHVIWYYVALSKASLEGIQREKNIHDSAIIKTQKFPEA